MRWELDLISAASADGGLVTATTLERVGVSNRQWRHAIEQERWRTVAPGVWCHAALPHSFALEVRAGSRWLQGRGATHGASSLRWQGIDVAEPHRAEFMVPRSLRYLAGPLLVHTTNDWAARDFVFVDGVRCSVATRAIIDWAAQAPTARRLEAAIDSAVHARRTSTGRLSKRLDELGGSGRPGTRLLRTLLPESGGESFLERRFLRLCRLHGIARPVPQVVHRAGTKFVARVDFQWTGTNVIVEVSGRLGHTSDRERAANARRRNELTRRGYVILEFATADVLDDAAYVVRSVREALGDARSDPFAS